MIPQWDVAIEVTAATPNVAGDLDGDLRLSPWVTNLGHIAIRPGDWDLAAETVAFEARMVAEADEASSDESTFEDALQRAEADSVDAEWAGLDLGVAGLVMTLNAAGFATATSCRKHPREPWAAYPFVLATGDDDRIAVLRPLVAEAGAGASPGAPGEGFGIYARAVTPLMALATLILRERATFAEMPTTIGWDEDAYEAETGW